MLSAEKMAAEGKIYDYGEESQTERLARKSKEMPLFPIGIAGLIAAVGLGAYKYNRRGNMSTSVFLMQLRVGAQGAVVGTLTLGLLYSMLKDYLPSGSENKKQQ